MIITERGAWRRGQGARGQLGDKWCQLRKSGGKKPVHKSTNVVVSRTNGCVPGDPPFNRGHSPACQPGTIWMAANKQLRAAEYIPTAPRHTYYIHIPTTPPHPRHPRVLLSSFSATTGMNAPLVSTNQNRENGFKVIGAFQNSTCLSRIILKRSLLTNVIIFIVAGFYFFFYLSISLIKFIKK